MTIKELYEKYPKAPQWLLAAETQLADVEYDTFLRAVVWRGGMWHGGVWRGGVWLGGVWLGKENRTLYMAALLGIAPDSDGYLTGYRSTCADGSGRYNRSFSQPEGEYYEDHVAPAGAGTCCPGIHVGSPVTAYTYFGIDPSAQLWRVRFRTEDLLDCDGQKARIRGGIFERIPWPFL